MNIADSGHQEEQRREWKEKSDDSRNPCSVEFQLVVDLASEFPLEHKPGKKCRRQYSETEKMKDERDGCSHGRSRLGLTWKSEGLEPDQQLCITARLR